MSEFCRRAAALLLQARWEQAVTDHLGRERYQRTDHAQVTTGHRPGYAPRKLLTAEGISVSSPR